MFELDEMLARHASYETLAEIIRRRFQNPQGDLRELFGRLTFNILCGNTDDHARNHAAFWDGKNLRLTLPTTYAHNFAPATRPGRAC
jgi:serine/threonine-protein kinase HipA